MPPRRREQGARAAEGRSLLTFRLDNDLRQRLRARLASEGRTLSEVVTHGLRQYVQRAGGRASAAARAGMARAEEARSGETPAKAGSAQTRMQRLADLALPENLAARLRDLRATGRSEVLSSSLAALHDSGWPLASLARALGISKQAVQARIRRAVRGRRDTPQAGGGSRTALTPPVFPRRRPPSANGRRPHLTIRVDRTLRSAAHDAAADEGSSLSEVVERILHRYLRYGLPGEPGKREPGKREPGKRQPGKRQPGKREPGKRQPGKRRGRAESR